jgi:regulatory protein
VGNAFNPADLQAARHSALAHLARRDHCKAELALKLIRVGFDAETSRAAVEALEQEKVVDDARFVQNFISYHAERGEGPTRIAYKLNSPTLELDKALVTQHMDGAQDWVERAREVRAKKFGAAMPASQTDVIKQAYFLQHRGFTTPQIRLALGTDIEIETDDDP